MSSMPLPRLERPDAQDGWPPFRHVPRRSAAAATGAPARTRPRRRHPARQSAGRSFQPAPVRRRATSADGTSTLRQRAIEPPQVVRQNARPGCQPRVAAQRIRDGERRQAADEGQSGPVGQRARRQARRAPASSYGWRATSSRASRRSSSRRRGMCSGAYRPTGNGNRRRSQRQILGLVDVEIGKGVDPRAHVRRRVAGAARRAPWSRPSGPIEVRIREDSYAHPSDLLMSKQSSRSLWARPRARSPAGEGDRGGMADGPAIARWAARAFGTCSVRLCAHGQVPPQGRPPADGR